MNKKAIFRITEEDVHTIMENVIKQALLKEGSTTDSGVPTAWENLKEMVGVETMLDAIWNYASEDTLKQYVDWMIDDYELDPRDVYEDYYEGDEEEDYYEEDDEMDDDLSL